MWGASFFGTNFFGSQYFGPPEVDSQFIAKFDPLRAIVVDEDIDSPFGFDPLRAAVIQ